MLNKRRLAVAKRPTERTKLHWNVLLGDLCFLASVALAHFIVWRTLRRRYAENSARRRQFKLLRGDPTLAQTQPQVVRGFDWRANAVATGFGGSSTERCKEGGHKCWTWSLSLWLLSFFLWRSPMYACARSCDRRFDESWNCGEFNCLGPAAVLPGLCAIAAGEIL